MRSVIRNKHFVCGLVFNIAMLLFLVYLLVFAQNNFESSVAVSTYRYYFFMLILIIDVYFSVKDRRIFFIYISELFIFYAWLSFADAQYSPIDESMNFENINHIVSHNKLATFEDTVDSVFLNEANNGNISSETQNYEAVQAPLYYIVMAIVGKLIDNAYARLHLFRLLSLLAVLLVYFFAKKTVLYLTEREIISVDEETFRLGVLLTVFNPGYLYRASRLNNEIMVCVLSAVLLYVVIKCVVDGYSKARYWEMSILCSALFLTKNTAVYVYAVITLVAFYQKRIRQVILPILGGALLIVPWFAFNYITYGTLTAMHEHMNIIVPVVNPTKGLPDIFSGFLTALLSYNIGDEISLGVVERTWVDAGCILLIFFIMGVIVENKNIAKAFLHEEEIRPFRRSVYGMNYYINMICIIWLVACILCLAAGTIITKIMSLQGRYFYGPSVVLIILLVLNRDIISKTAWKYVSLIFIITLGMVSARGAITFLDRVYSTEHLFASNANNLVLLDWTDEYWTHGYCLGDNRVMVEIDDKSVGADYKVLEGWLISNGMQSTLITAVSDVEILGEKRFVELSTAIHMNPDNAGCDHLQVARPEEYNTQEIDSVIGDIGGKEILQTLHMKETGLIYGYEIMLGTYEVENYAATVEYKVKNSGGDVLQMAEVELDQIRDNEYATIYFTEPIKVQKGEEIGIAMTYHNNSALPLAMYVSEQNRYKEGVLCINGVEDENIDMGFRLFVN